MKRERSKNLILQYSISRTLIYRFDNLENEFLSIFKFFKLIFSMLIDSIMLGNIKGKLLVLFKHKLNRLFFFFSTRIFRNFSKILTSNSSLILTSIFKSFLTLSRTISYKNWSYDYDSNPLEKLKENTFFYIVISFVCFDIFEIFNLFIEKFNLIPFVINSLSSLSNN